MDNRPSLLEVILYVNDMQKMVSFYRTAFNLKVSYPIGLEDYSQISWVTLDTGACTLALHSGGEGQLGKDAPKIVFGVAGIHEWRARLENLGVKIGKVFEAAPDTHVCNGSDPEGNAFSIEEHNQVR